METKEAKIRNLLTPFCNMIALHKKGLDIPEEIWNVADENFDRMLGLLVEEDNNVTETAESADNKPQVDREKLLRKYYNAEQIEWIKNGLSQRRPQTTHIEDMRFVKEDGVPEEGRGCELYYPNNSLTVGCNLGYYAHGQFWYTTVKDGRFSEDRILPRPVCSYIYLSKHDED